MELIYSMRRKPLKCEPPHFERTTDPEVVRPICTISCGNIIAFSSPTELNDVDCDTWGGHVYVCDLDTPWDSHKVISTTHPVSALEWDGEGKQLLVATTEGEVTVFGQKDFLLNEWVCLYNANFPGEHIVKAVFFHNGRRVVTLDKKADAPITERIQELRSAPTLKGFGGVALPGACVISATGSVCALTADASCRASESLRANRDHVTCASFAHKNGSLLLAAVCVSACARACVRVCVCVVTRTGASPAPLPALALTKQTTLLTNNIPTSVCWSVRSEPDALLVGGPTLTLWKLVERQHAVHKLLSKGPLQGSTTPGGGQKPTSDCFNTLAWQQTGVWAVEGGACSGVSSARLAVGAPHAVLATAKKLHLLGGEHHYICSRAVVTSGPEPAVASPPKKPKIYGNSQTTNGALCAIVTSVDISWLGGVVVAVDSHSQIHAFRLQPWTDIPPGLSVPQATSLLEYAMVAGCDATDIHLTLKQNIIEAVYERLTENFQRQPAAFQQYYFHTWLKMRIALCRLMPTAMCSVSWLTCVQTLWTLWAAVSAALRPDDKPDDKPLHALLDDKPSEQEKTLWTLWAAVSAALRPDDKPDDKPLHALLDDKPNEKEKALIALESKPELPSEASVLVALRRPLQRAVDIAVTALAAAAHHPDTQGHHGYSLWADPVGVSLLRRLVVLARGAGTGDPAISRLLARLHQPNKPELIEECAAISSMYGARVWEALPRVCVSAPHAAPPPLYCEYGIEPESLRVNPSPPPAAHTDLTPAHQMDSIRYTYLTGGTFCRRCGRCGSRALPGPQPARHPLQRAHDARLLPACRCGGKWSLVSITEQNHREDAPTRSSYDNWGPRRELGAANMLGSGR